MKTLNTDEMEMIVGGKFWGTECASTPFASEFFFRATLDDGSSAGGNDNIGERCYYNCNYYVLGVAVSSSTQVGSCPDTIGGHTVQ